MPIALRQTFAPSFARLHEPHPQRGMGTHKVIVRPPPLQMGQQLWSLLGRGPGAASQRGYAMADRQIHSFDKGGVELSREAQSL